MNNPKRHAACTGGIPSKLLLPILVAPVLGLIVLVLAVPGYDKEDGNPARSTEDSSPAREAGHGAATTPSAAPQGGSDGASTQQYVTEPRQATTPQRLFLVLQRAAQRQSQRTIYRLLDGKTRTYLETTRRRLLKSLQKEYDAGQATRQEYLRHRDKIDDLVGQRKYFIFAYTQAEEPKFATPNRCALRIYSASHTVNGERKYLSPDLMLVKEGNVWRIDQYGAMQAARAEQEGTPPPLPEHATR